MKQKIDDVYPKHIKIGDRTEITTTDTKEGKRHNLVLEDNIPIKDVALKPGSKDSVPPLAMGEVKDLMFYRKIPRKKGRVELVITYCGKNTQRRYNAKLYRSILNRQACLLLALCESENKELTIESANKILNDKTRCRFPSQASDPYDAVSWVVKNLRRAIGFTSNELYISKNPPVVGLRAIK